MYAAVSKHCNAKMKADIVENASASWPEYVERSSLRKQPTFRDASTGLFAKWCLRNGLRNSILLTCHYPDLGGWLLIDWSKFSTNQKHDQDLGCDTSSVWNLCAYSSDVISWETVSSIAIPKCRLGRQTRRNFSGRNISQALIAP